MTADPGATADGGTAPEDTVERIEAVMEKPDDQLAEELPDLLEEIDGRTEELLLQHPALFAQVTQRMEAVDVAAFANERPATVERFQEMLWTGMELIVQASPDVRESITEDVGVNFQADDAPMTGHLEVDADEETVRGGTDHLDDPDLTITGPADRLVGLITGRLDPVEGFMQGTFEMDGDVRKGTELASTMGELTKMLPD